MHFSIFSGEVVSVSEQAIGDAQFLAELWRGKNDRTLILSCEFGVARSDYQIVTRNLENSHLRADVSVDGEFR